MIREQDEAVEVVTGGPDAGVVLTCEHASAELPAGWAWPEGDRWLAETHWAVDLGAEALTRELAEALGCPAVLAVVSRLVIDLNRPTDSPTLIRTVADGRRVALNDGVGRVERDERIRRYYDPFHAMVDRVVREQPAALVFSIHSFTPEYEGERRRVEIGVLVGESDLAEGERLRRTIGQALGVDARLNEPYSGLAGLMFSPAMHADAHGRLALEIEVRQDRLVDATFRAALVACLARYLRDLSGQLRTARS